MLSLILNLVAFLKPFYPPGSIQHSPFAGEKGMAFTAYLHLELFLGGTGGKSIPAGTYYLGIIEIIGMNLFFHNY